MNGTYPALRCTYNTSSFFQTAGDLCARFIDPIQVRPAKNVTPAVRLEAASQLALCMETVWARNWPENGQNVSMSATLSLDPASPLNQSALSIPRNPSCGYPEFLPILEKTCKFDLNHYDKTCNTTSYGDGGNAGGYNYTACQEHAAIQFVRCTLQKQPEEVEDCVAQNAVKVDWLAQLQSYTGAKSCPSIILYLAIQVIHVLRHVIGSLLSVLLLPVAIRAFHRKWSERKSASHSIETALQPSSHWNNPSKDSYHVTERSADDLPAGTPISPWTREMRYTLKATRMLQTVGREVLVAYLTYLILNQSKHFRASNSFSEEISFYVIRPRPAPFYGVLGFFVPWSQKALAELVVDGILSFIAGTNVASKFWHTVNKPPANPAAPAGDLKTLAVGAIMMCIPAFTVLVITFLVSLGFAAQADEENDGRRKKKKDDDNGCGFFIAALCLWAMQLLLIGLFIASLPLIAIIEMIASTVVTIRHNSKRRKAQQQGNSTFVDQEDDSWAGVVQRARSRWEEPLTTTSSWFRFLYVLFVLASFIINVGNWIFFGMYLTLEGEMFCPAKVAELIAVWILVPFGIDALFFWFRSWTGDILFDAQANWAVAM